MTLKVASAHTLLVFVDPLSLARVYKLPAGDWGGVGSKERVLPPDLPRIHELQLYTHVALL